MSEINYDAFPDWDFINHYVLLAYPHVLHVLTTADPDQWIEAVNSFFEGYDTTIEGILRKNGHFAVCGLPGEQAHALGEVEVKEILQTAYLL